MSTPAPRIDSYQRYSSVPDEIREVDGWMGYWLKKPARIPRGGWRDSTPQKKGDEKRPASCRDGQWGSSSNAATHSSFNQALVSVPEFGFDGLGVVLPEPFHTLDFDGVVSAGIVEPYILRVLEFAGDPLTWLSSSCRGLHAITRGPYPEGPHQFAAKDKKHYGVMLCRPAIHQFIALTGQRVQGEGIPTPESTSLVYFLLSQILDEKFKRLFMGDVSGYPSGSEADCAFIAKTARALNYNRQNVRALFELSALGVSADLRGKDTKYFDRTFDNILKDDKRKEEQSKPEPRGTTKIPEQAPADAERVPLTVLPGESPAATDESEAILLTHAERLRILQRAGEVVQIVEVPELTEELDGALQIPAGTSIIKAVSSPALAETFDRLIQYQKWSKRDKQNVNVDCPPRIVASYLARSGFHRLPILNGIIHTPILCRDGSAIIAPGYHRRTGLYFCAPKPWPALPDKPAKKDAAAALDVLMYPFQEFPFCRDADLSVHLAGILTGLQRKLIPFAPLFVYTAPVPRTGKSLLAETLALIASGRPAPSTTASSEEEEIRKVITAVLYSGVACAAFDNVEGTFGSSALCVALTQHTYRDRILSESKMLDLPTRVLWTLTGNNVHLRGDLVVRSLSCSIDPKMEFPEEREFEISDLRGYVLEHRERLVIAALTILKAFILAKRPQPKSMKAWGGFDYWSENIRAALIWLGCADPCDTRKDIASSDPELDDAAALLAALWKAYSDGSFTVREIAERANPPFGVLPDNDLLDAVLGVAETKGAINRKLLGKWLLKWKDRVIAGKRVRKAALAGGREKVVKWRVEVV